MAAVQGHPGREGRQVPGEIEDGYRGTVQGNIQGTAQPPGQGQPIGTLEARYVDRAEEVTVVARGPSREHADRTSSPDRVFQ